MNFFNRFSFFLIGILLGCVLILFSLQFRNQPLSFNYFPESRVKNFLIKNSGLFSSNALCKINCYNLDTLLLSSYIENSVVDFKKSKIRGYNPKVYYLSVDLPIQQDKEYFIKVESLATPGSPIIMGILFPSELILIDQFKIVSASKQN